VLLSLACVQVSRNESVAFSSEYYSVIGVAVVGLIMIIVQTSLGIEMYNKVSQWNAVSKTCEKKEDPKAKAFAQTTFGVMVTFLVLTLVFIVLFIARTYQLKRARRTGGGGGIGRGGAQSTSVGMSSFFTRE
jgi:magnesium-transporting ATPase (P-type)